MDKDLEQNSHTEKKMAEQKGNNLDVQLYISSRHKMVHESWDWDKEQVEHHVSEILWVIIWS